MESGGPALIRDARARAGLSQAELARRVGTSQAAISAYENGQRDPGFSQVERLLAATGWALEARLVESAGRGPGDAPDAWSAVDSDEDDDRILENLRLTPTERLRKLGRLREFTRKYRGALARQR